jgi:hypothetical protein
MWTHPHHLQPKTMPNDKSPPKSETAPQQETSGDCVSRLVRRCPVCNYPVKTLRYMKSYWQVRCVNQHFSASSATPMKTKKQAESVWDSQFPPNVPTLAHADEKLTDHSK